MVTGLPFYATKNGCRQLLPNGESEPELFGVTRRQALGLSRLSRWRRRRRHRLGRSRRDRRSRGDRCSHTLGGGLGGRCGHRQTVDREYVAAGRFAMRGRSANGINSTGNDNDTDRREYQPSGLATHGAEATLRRVAALGNRAPRHFRPRSRATSALNVQPLPAHKTKPRGLGPRGFSPSSRSPSRARCGPMPSALPRGICFERESRPRRRHGCSATRPARGERHGVRYFGPTTAQM